MQSFTHRFEGYWLGGRTSAADSARRGIRAFPRGFGRNRGGRSSAEPIADLNDNEHLDYVLNGKQLKKTEQEKDLGVLTSGTLLLNDQIESCISKANQMLCWISRNLISREKSLMLRVYKTLIRPHLEYCVQLWNPAAEHGNWSLILRIESVQRRFTRMIEEVGLLPYSERLWILQLTTLAERRSRGDLIEVYKANKGFSQ